MSEVVGASQRELASGAASQPAAGARPAAGAATTAAAGGALIPRLPVWERYQNLLLGMASVGLFLLAWETVANRGWLDPLFVSSPLRILRAFSGLVGAGDLWVHIRVSLYEFVLGFGLAVLTAVPVGALAGWYRPLFAITNPFIAGLNATPRDALMPLVVIWLGIGIWSKVALVFLGAFFPIAFNMMTALRTLDASLVRMARSFGARDGHIFRTIALPASVPFLIAGLRVGAGRGLVGIVIGELYAATVGVGYLIALYGSTFQTDKLFVGVAVITTLGVALDVLLRRLERRFELWRPRVGA